MTSMLMVHLQMIGRVFAQRFQYRADYILSSLAMFLGELTVPIMAVLIYNESPGFPGWNLYELLLLQGIFLLVKGLSFPLFFGILWNSINKARHGTMELILLKPRPKLWYFIADSFDTEDVAKFFAGLMMVLYSTYKLDITINIITFFPYYILGVGMFFGSALLCSAIALHTVEAWRLYEVMDSIWMVAQYPQDIFSGFIGTLSTNIIPLALVASIPASMIIEKTMPSLFPMILAEIVFIVSSYAIWEIATRSYSGAGG